jgi:2-polyprenyl-6-methoxyphenol hydroxylase-like FAD-dependent oxidoreductase
MRVLVIGAGLGGLCLAQGLRRMGIECVVFEQQCAREDNLSGYGLHIDINGKQALRQCLPHGLWTMFLESSAPAGAKVRFRDPQLRVLAERDVAQISKASAVGIERRGIGRDQLRDILLGDIESEFPLNVQWGKAFTRYEICANGQVHAYFKDGTVVAGDILIGADGPHSLVRKQYLSAIERLDLGIHTIAGRCPLDTGKTLKIPEDLIDGSINNIVPYSKGWMFLSCWSHFGPKSGRVQRQLVWAYVLPQQKTFRDLPSSGSGLQELVCSDIKAWSPTLTEIVRRTDSASITCIPLRTMPSLQHWAPSNVTLLGDAIHNMTPMAGQGANTALRDARVLADALADAVSGTTSVKTAIGAYEDAMRRYANAAIELSRRNAEGASSSKKLDRILFRFLLHAAQASPFVMRQTLGQSVANSTY